MTLLEQFVKSVESHLAFHHNWFSDWHKVEVEQISGNVWSHELVLKEYAIIREPKHKPAVLGFRDFKVVDTSLLTVFRNDVRECHYKNHQYYFIQLNSEVWVKPTGKFLRVSMPLLFKG